MSTIRPDAAEARAQVEPRPRGRSRNRRSAESANVRAQLCMLVKRILRKYGYAPDKQEKATITVLEQAAALSARWAAA